jgi:flagellin
VWPNTRSNRPECGAEAALKTKGLIMFSVTAGAGASGIAYQLDQNGKNLRKSLERLSTNRRINSSADDPGGLGVSMKLGVSIRRTEAAITQVNSTASFLQTQDGVLKVANNIVERMSELATYGSSATLSASDRALYSTEFNDLQDQLDSLLAEEFNGQDLFLDSGTTTPASTTTPSTVSLTGQTLGISTLDLGSVTNLVAGGSAITIATQAGATAAAEAVDAAIDNLGSLRATNGSEQSRVDFAVDLLETNKLNLEAANSNIVDVDFASELVRYTTYSILDQQGIALLAQANTRSEKILKLLD